MIFVDSNVPMYLVGADHPNKAHARRLLERVVADGEALATDAEVLQEILHRYTAIDRREAIGPFSARDAIHVAVMQGRDIGRILTFDTAFDGVPGIARVTEHEGL